MEYGAVQALQQSNVKHHASLYAQCESEAQSGKEGVLNSTLLQPSCPSPLLFNAV